MWSVWSLVSLLVCLPACLPVCLPVCLSDELPSCLCTCLPVYLQMPVLSACCSMTLTAAVQGPGSMLPCLQDCLNSQLTVYQRAHMSILLHLCFVIYLYLLACQVFVCQTRICSRFFTPRGSHTRLSCRQALTHISTHSHTCTRITQHAHTQTWLAPPAVCTTCTKALCTIRTKAIRPCTSHVFLACARLQQCQDVCMAGAAVAGCQLYQ